MWAVVLRRLWKPCVPVWLCESLLDYSEYLALKITNQLLSISSGWTWCPSNGEADRVTDSRPGPWVDQPRASVYLSEPTRCRIYNKSQEEIRASRSDKFWGQSSFLFTKCTESPNRPDQTLPSPRETSWRPGCPQVVSVRPYPIYPWHHLCCTSKSGSVTPSNG